MPSEPSPETLLARNLASLLASNYLGVYRPTGNPYELGEHCVLIDQQMPTKNAQCTVLNPLQTLSEGRSERVYRVQFVHRLAATDVLSATGAARAHAQAVAQLLDHREYTPPILGISWAEEYSRTVFDPDTQDLVIATQNFLFRGRRP